MSKILIKLSTIHRIFHMKAKSILLVITLITSFVFRSHADGIPEPGLVLHGAIRKAGNGNRLLTSGTLTWNVQASPNGPAVSVSTLLANLNNGLYSYRVRIPYESMVGGNTLGPNSFDLPSTTTAFNRELVLVSGGQTVSNENPGHRQSIGVGFGGTD